MLLLLLLLLLVVVVAVELLRVVQRLWAAGLVVGVCALLGGRWVDSSRCRLRVSAGCLVLVCCCVAVAWGLQGVVPACGAEQIFNMQFTARQLNKLSQKHEKDAAKEKKKIKAVRIPRGLLCCPNSCPLTEAPFRAQAIDKGNREGAQIYAENTIRKKNEALQMLQCALPPSAGSCKRSADSLPVP